jgi:hypothetical protein
MPVEMTYTETLLVTHCWCGIALAVPENLHAYAKRHKGKEIYCPLGHTFVYTDTFEEKYEREQRAHRATRDLLGVEERSHVATRGHLTRARARAAAGVCPCCHRSFENLARHVKSKHPDFKPSELPK